MPQDEYYLIYESYASDVKGQNIFEEEDFFDMEDQADQLDGDLDMGLPEPSTNEKIRAAADRAELEKYNVTTAGDTKDGKDGAVLELSGHYSAPELRWLADKAEQVNMEVYGTNSSGEEVANPA